MVIKVDAKKLIKNIAIPLGGGALAGFLTKNGVEKFNATAAKPVFMPPGWLFPVAWSILYILMGIAAYYVETATPLADRKKAMTLYYIQLALNFAWSFIFFSARKYLLALIWVAAMLGVIVATTAEFYKLNKKAGYLMIPYNIWTAFAMVLNFAVWMMNK